MSPAMRSTRLETFGVLRLDQTKTLFDLDQIGFHFREVATNGAARQSSAALCNKIARAIDGFYDPVILGPQL
jgi:hypothetical protein